MNTTEAGSGVRAISRALAILRIINREGALNLTEIARQAGVPYPTALRIVGTLVDEGVIEREPSRKWYRPTASIQALSYGFQNHDRLVDAARAHIMDLTHELHWPISIVTRVGNAMVVRDSTSTLTPMTFSHYYPGWQVPLVASASGRAFLAHATPEVLQEFALYYETHGHWAEAAELQALEADGENARIRARGYATAACTPYTANPGKTSSIALPLFEGDALLGSLTLVFFASAMSLSTAVARFVPPMERTATCIQESLVRSWGGRHERHSNPVRIEAGASEGATCKRSRASPARACHTQTG